MDYCELLYKAQENKINASQKEVRCYTTSFTPPKKVARSNVSSVNVQRFLARREEEEKKKKLEAKKKKDELLALRSQDKKAQKRVQVMLKRTKSANKSVMADAIDNVDTAVTLAGPKQCDEDDYGYVSQEASAYYNKLMDKYQNTPAEKSIFAKTKHEVKDLKAAKDRVKAALQRVEEEEMAPHKRKRKKKDKDNENEHVKESHDSSEDVEEREETKVKDPKREVVEEQPVKKKRPVRPPPPVDFAQLLKIAEKKQFEPIVIEKVETEKEPERLMTKKEKMEYEREMERRSKKDVNKNNIDSRNLKPIPKVYSPKEPLQVKPKAPASKPIEEIEDSRKLSADKSKLINSVDEKLKKSSKVWSKSCNSSVRSEPQAINKSSKQASEKEKKVFLKPGIKPESTRINRSPDDKLNYSKPSSTSKLPVDSSYDEALDQLSDIDREIELLRRKRELLVAAKTLKEKVSKEAPSVDVEKKIINSRPQKQVEPQREQTKPVLKEPVRTVVIKEPMKPSPSKDHTRDAKDSMKLTARREQVFKEVAKTSEALKKRKIDLKRLKSKKRRLDSDSEFDSELEDFIDDDDTYAAETDYSKHIKEIFGYDKSRYKHLDEDEECIESNFAQLMKEEFVSTKLGILEDLEDIRKEQEEKARKKMLKKR